MNKKTIDTYTKLPTFAVNPAAYVLVKMVRHGEARRHTVNVPNNRGTTSPFTFYKLR